MFYVGHDTVDKGSHDGWNLGSTFELLKKRKNLRQQYFSHTKKNVFVIRDKMKQEINKSYQIIKKTL